MTEQLKSDLVDKGSLVRPVLAEIFSDIFQYTGELQPKTCRLDVPRWDSLRHVALIVAIETAFGITMSMDEMQEILSVGDIDRVLERHGV